MKRIILVVVVVVYVELCCVFIMEFKKCVAGWLDGCEYSLTGPDGLQGVHHNSTHAYMSDRRSKVLLLIVTKTTKDDE